MKNDFTLLIGSPAQFENNSILENARIFDDKTFLYITDIEEFKEKLFSLVNLSYQTKVVLITFNPFIPFILNNFLLMNQVNNKSNENKYKYYINNFDVFDKNMKPLGFNNGNLDLIGENEIDTFSIHFTEEFYKLQEELS